MTTPSPRYLQKKFIEKFEVCGLGGGGAGRGWYGFFDECAVSFFGVVQMRLDLGETVQQPATVP